jgi:hypothetical protein
MKLSSRDAAAYFRKPDTRNVGVLISGEDVMRVAMRRQEVILALVGPQGEAEMRLTRIPAADLRKDPAMALDAVKAQGFFPGPRIVFVEDATDGLTETLSAVLSAWNEGDAQIVVTGGNLTGTGALRVPVRTRLLMIFLLMSVMPIAVQAVATLVRARAASVSAKSISITLPCRTLLTPAKPRVPSA